MIGILIVLMMLVGGFAVDGQEGEVSVSDDELLKLLDSLEADKEVEAKYVPGPEGGKPADRAAPRRSPIAIIKDVSTRMELVIKEMNKPMITEVPGGEAPEIPDAQEQKPAPPDGELIVKEQKEIIKLLDELLNMAQSRSGKSGGGGGGGAAGGGQQGGAGAVKPMMSLPQGGGSDDKKPTRHIPPPPGDENEPWGLLPDAMRDEILQIMQEDIPLLYRELLREYYKDLEKE